MKLQGRNISSGMQGDDVKLLQAELQQLGYAVPTTELASAVFGAGTYDAVGSFQSKNELPVTNMVDATTGGKITAAIDALQTSPVPPAATGFIGSAAANLVRGEVRGADATPLSGVVVQAFDKQLKSERILGVTNVGADGRYELPYQAGPNRPTWWYGSSGPLHAPSEPRRERRAKWRLGRAHPW